MVSEDINVFRFNNGHWQVIPIFDCLWEERILIIIGTCTGLNEMVKVVVPGGSLGWQKIMWDGQS